MLEEQRRPFVEHPGITTDLVDDDSLKSLRVRDRNVHDGVLDTGDQVHCDCFG